MKKRILSAAGAAVVALALLFFPLQALADSAAIRAIDIDVDIQQDGSAWITEVWDIQVVEGTEWYIAKYFLDNQPITNLTVTDEAGVTYQDVGVWNPDRPREDKIGKSGIAEAHEGYELCWGIAEYGAHVYTVRYKMANLVKGYEGADALRQVFIPENLPAPVEEVTINIHAADIPLTEDNTNSAVFNFSANYFYKDGAIVVESDQPMETDQQAAVLVTFTTGVLAPIDVRDVTIEAIQNEAFEGSDYGSENGGDDAYTVSPGSAISSFFRTIRNLIVPIGMGLAFVVIAAASSKRNSAGARKHMKPEYKDPGFSRDIPFHASLPATYTRLEELGQLPNDGTVIGAYLLRWVRSGQVEIVKQPAGMFKNKEQDAIKLYDARQDMPPVEKSLYSMLISAAGQDWILESKEFEKWSKRSYTTVQSWLEKYKNIGHEEMRNMGAATEENVKTFFGLINTRQTVMTPEGETLTGNMFGFKKYLEDFTIINEREAREVQLWDDYLVFAQIYGIADKVAEQFKQLYPDYFTQTQPGMSGRSLDMYDMILISHLANNYGRAMSSGYHAGYDAAQSARFTGGGGHSSMGGGGGFSGGGGGFSGGGSR